MVNHNALISAANLIPRDWRIAASAAALAVSGAACGGGSGDRIESLSQIGCEAPVIPASVPETTPTSKGPTLEELKADPEGVTKRIAEEKKAKIAEQTKNDPPTSANGVALAKRMEAEADFSLEKIRECLDAESGTGAKIDFLVKTACNAYVTEERGTYEFPALYSQLFIAGLDDLYDSLHSPTASTTPETDFYSVVDDQCPYPYWPDRPLCGTCGKDE